MTTVSVAPSPSSTNRPLHVAVTSEITRVHVSWAVGFIAVHVVLAIMMRAVPAIATAHAIACTGAGLIYAATTRRIRNIAIVVAYIAGCEVLWRMNKADVFYEFGKYSIIAILIIALVRIRSPRNRTLALIYLGLLLPSIALTFTVLGFGAARQQVGFTMSGPVAITVAIVFFSNVRLNTNQMRATFVALIGPVTGIATLSFMSTSSSDALDFGNGSNVVTSGGFGPNQVSAMLGVAAMFLLLISFDRSLRWHLRLPTVALAALFSGFSALTFSRGGITLAFAGAAGAMFVLMRSSRRGRLTVAMVAVFSLILGKYVIEPRLDAITQGKLSERYANTQSSGRDVYAGSELTMFADNPVLGVGPGIGSRVREETGMIGAASHTEYTRMLAEHGVLGLLSLLCLLILGARAFLDSSDLISRAHATAMLIWVGLFLLIYGTRIAAPAIVFGLAFVMRPRMPALTSGRARPWSGTRPSD